MEESAKLKYLKIALLVFGIIFVVGLIGMMKLIKTTSWTWMPGQPEYEWMIIGVYATLGLFLIKASKNPLENLSLIWFTIFSSIVHAGIMLVQAIVDTAESSNLYGDIPALFLVAIVLWVLMPRKA